MVGGLGRAPGRRESIPSTPPQNEKGSAARSPFCLQPSYRDCGLAQYLVEVAVRMWSDFATEDQSVIVRWAVFGGSGLSAWVRFGHLRSIRHRRVATNFAEVAFWLWPVLGTKDQSAIAPCPYLVEVAFGLCFGLATKDQSAPVGRGSMSNYGRIGPIAFDPKCAFLYYPRP